MDIFFEQNCIMNSHPLFLNKCKLEGEELEKNFKEVQE